MKQFKPFRFDNYIFMLLYRFRPIWKQWLRKQYGVGGRGYGSNNGRMSQMNHS
jgi:hypothetical protein